MDASAAAPPAVASDTVRLAPEAFAERARAMEAEVGRVIVGQRELVRQTLVGLLANSSSSLKVSRGWARRCSSAPSRTSSTAGSAGSSSPPT